MLIVVPVVMIVIVTVLFLPAPILKAASSDSEVMCVSGTYENILAIISPLYNIFDSFVVY